MSYLQIGNLNKSFNQTIALNNISLSIEAGEFICFLGPSGCGKTTLLRTICGLEQQDSGQIIQNKIDTSNLPAEQRDFGIVFQSYALFPNLNVFDNIAFGLVNQRKEKKFIKQKVAELLQLTGMQDHKNKFPSQLSGGQQQRVALARALAMQPGLLLLDEPLSALDAKIRESLRQEICRVHKQLGLTTIMVTHDQAEAMSMADRIVVMNAGQIEQIGTPQDIYLRPNSAFVADFIGTSNTLNGKFNQHLLHLQGWNQPITISEQAKQENSLVLIRPEHVKIHTTPPETPHAAVRIGSVEFLGSQLLVEVLLDTPQQTPLNASKQLSQTKALKAAVPLAEAQELKLSSNQPAWVSVQGDHCRLLPESGEVAA